MLVRARFTLAARTLFAVFFTRVRRMLALVICMPAFTCVACESTAQDRHVAPPPVVRLAAVRRVRRSENVDLSGTIESPDPPAALAFLVSGRIARVFPHEGDSVRAGEVLARLDPGDLQTVLDAAVARTARVQAARDKVDAPARGEDRAQAGAAYAEAADAYDRARRLDAERGITAADLRRARTAFETARAKRDEARAGAVPQDRSAARAAVAEARAAEDGARRQIAETTLRAPRDGYVARVAVAAGDLAAPGVPAVVIVSLDPLEARVDVPESQLHLLRLGAPAQITVPAVPGRTFAGIVRAIGVSADAASRTYAVHVRLSNPRLVLRVGMVARTTIHGDRSRMLVRVPGAAVRRDPQGATFVYIYAEREHRVYARGIDAGTVAGAEIDVTGGLSGDERVVVAGAQRLIDGSVVEVAPAP